MADWPSTLPQTQFAGVTTQDDDSRLVSQMDAGPASVRNRFTAITKSIKTQMVLTGAQLDTFNTFVRTTLNHYTNSFTWTDPEDDSSVTFRFKSKPAWQCIKPAPTANDRLWSATLDLEILP